MGMGMLKHKALTSSAAYIFNNLITSKAGLRLQGYLTKLILICLSDNQMRNLLQDLGQYQCSPQIFWEYEQVLNLPNCLQTHLLRPHLHQRCLMFWINQNFLG